MKHHPSHIDWGKVVVTAEIMTGYVYPKYGLFNLSKDDPMIETIIEDIYDTFYRDKDEQAEMAAKESVDANLSIMKAMVEAEKARDRPYTKMVVSDDKITYVWEKYESKWTSKDKIASVILEDLWQKYRKDETKRAYVPLENNHKNKRKLR